MKDNPISDALRDEEHAHYFELNRVVIGAGRYEPTGEVLYDGHSHSAVVNIDFIEGEYVGALEFAVITNDASEEAEDCEPDSPCVLMSNNAIDWLNMAASMISVAQGLIDPANSPLVPRGDSVVDVMSEIESLLRALEGAGDVAITPEDQEED